MPRAQELPLLLFLLLPMLVLVRVLVGPLLLLLFVVDQQQDGRVGVVLKELAENDIVVDAQALRALLFRQPRRRLLAGRALAAGLVVPLHHFRSAEEVEEVLR